MQPLRTLGVGIFLLFVTTLSYSVTDVKKTEFGKMPDGRAVDLYTLKNSSLEVRVITYGARLVSVIAPDKNGQKADVVLGFDNLDGYLKDTSSYGSTVGRYAGRIANGRFTLEGHIYETPKNDGPNTLHGGPENFGKQLWSAKEIRNGVELTYVSKDGEAGFPGTLTTVTRYTLSGNDLRIEIDARTDKPTVLNLTNHAYFNLAGEGSGDVLKQEVKINARRMAPVNAGLIPSGEVKPVAGGPFDFPQFTAIGKNIDAKDDQLKYGIGYDMSYALENRGKIVTAAEAHDPASGRLLEVLTDQPVIHFYTGNHMDGVTGKNGHKYAFRNAFCFEAQHFADSPNHPEFPSTELKPGEKFHHVIVYRFTTQ